jgi:hypothetical protein
MTKYHIGKDKYVYKILERNGHGEPAISKRQKLDTVTQSLYIVQYMRYLGFIIEDMGKAKETAPFTVQFLQAQYLTLYKGKDIEIDEDVLFKSLREVGRVQKELSKPK